MPSGIYQHRKGFKQTKEHKDKIRQSHIGLKYKSMSEEGRENIRKSLVGRKLSKEHCKNMGLVRRGEKNWKWKGGISRDKQGCVEYRSCHAR